MIIHILCFQSKYVSILCFKSCFIFKLLLLRSLPTIFKSLSLNCRNTKLKHCTRKRSSNLTCCNKTNQYSQTYNTMNTLTEKFLGVEEKYWVNIQGSMLEKQMRLQLSFKPMQERIQRCYSINFCKKSDLFMSFFKMFHENSNNNINKNKLSQQNKDDKVERGKYLM